jgi:hypothetical protein
MLPIMLALALEGAEPDAAQLDRMAARFARAELKVDTAALSNGDRQALAKLIEAARVVDDIYLDQLWSGNHALLAKLRADTSPLGRARLRYFWLNKGPWSEIDDHAAFLADVPPKKLPGANFYPPDITKAEFEKWATKQATGFFTVITRDGSGRLAAVPYSKAYAKDLAQCATLLKEAAALTENATLKKFLTLRAAAFLSDDYYASDVAWMDLDAPLDITIGPYETYTDELFGYKAAFEAYVNVRDDQETAKLQFFANHMQEIEDNLPIDPKYRNPKIGAAAPIRVVNEVLAVGDGSHGVQTAAYNLPNDERVVHEKGSKRVMLKNVQEAKFRSTLEPIARRVLAAGDQADVSFDAFFTHILAHELTHGIGPQRIKVGGRDTTPRQEMKELHSAIEEAKADICGLFMLQYMYDRGQLPRGPDTERRLYTTFLASAFRTLRFGLKEAHGRGMALQFNYLMDKGAFVTGPGGTFRVDAGKIKSGVRALAGELLTIEATGDYAGAKRMLEQYAVLRPEMQRAFEKLKDLPTDIEPVYVTAEAIAPAREKR